MPPFSASSLPQSSYQQSIGPIHASLEPLSYSTNTGEPSPIYSSTPHTYSYSATQPNLPPTSIDINSSSYPLPPFSYDIDNTPLPTLYPATPSFAPYYSHKRSSSLAPHSSRPGLRPTSNQNPSNKPIPRKELQCWEHGCNGRQFTTSSNLRRHQREKSSVAQKYNCPNCKAKFTRPTARDNHVQDKKCISRRK